MQKELDRYLLPVSRKKYKTERRFKKIHLKVIRCDTLSVTAFRQINDWQQRPLAAPRTTGSKTI